MGSNATESHGNVIAGELTLAGIGSPVYLPDRPCKSVWLGAPTAAHAVAKLNSGVALVGLDQGVTDPRIGGQTLAADDFRGFLIPIDNANKVAIAGIAADVVEYQIFY